MFPRREFTADDLERSLLELELAPSASIVLLPVSNTPPQHTSVSNMTTSPSPVILDISHPNSQSMSVHKEIKFDKKDESETRHFGLVVLISCK